MIRFTAKRIVNGIALLAVVAIGSFFMAHSVFKDPTRAIIGNSATEEQMAMMREQLGLNRSLGEQFWDWFSKAVHGDFGTSWKTHMTVWTDLGTRIPVTLSIVVFGLGLCAVLGGVVGVVSGLKPGGVVDRILKAFSIVLFSLPGFWISLVLILFFAVKLGWLPALGYVRPATSVVGWLRSITLPAVSLALGGIVMIGEQLRNAIVTAAQQDFVRTLRSRGLRGWSITLHLLRNSAPAALTVLALMFVSLMGGAIIIETIFNLPGLGIRTQQAATAGDIPILVGITCITVAFVIIVNFLLDLVLGWINPKARVQ
jgi:peptide/nickel transport system permease protein